MDANRDIRAIDDAEVSVSGSAHDISDVQIVLASFDSAFPVGAAYGEQTVIAWSELTQILTKRRQGKKDGPNYVFARLKPEIGATVRRLGVNVIARTAIVLDCETNKDSGEVPPSTGETISRVRQQGWCGALYTSHSHKADAPRFRLIVPLTEEIDPALPAPEVIAELLGLRGVLDESKITAVSLFYRPSCESGTLDAHEAVVIPGKPIAATWMREQAGALQAARDAERDRQKAERLAARERAIAERIAKGLPESSNPIAATRDRLDLETELLNHGYQSCGRKFLYPQSESGAPGVSIIQGDDGIERVHSFHANDPLAPTNLPSWCTTKGVDVVDVVTILDFGGDRRTALHTLATKFGIESRLRRSRAKDKPVQDTLQTDDPTSSAGDEQSSPPPPKPPGLPHIQVMAGELHTMTTAAEAAIIQAGIPLYQRGISLVRPATQTVPASNGRSTVSAVLAEVSGAALVDTFCQVAVWERYDARSKSVVRCNPPSQVAEILLSRFGQWKLPHISGVVTAPTMRPDGSILSAPGYDPVTRLFHAANPDLALSPKVKNPTKETAHTALKLLFDLLEEFPLTDDVSKSVALSALITPVVRGALSVVPMHGFRATTAGTGKSYLVDISSAISSGVICPVAAAGESDAETEKRLTGLLLAGFPIASLDNVNGELGGDLLCQAIERPFMRLRRLGGSDITEVENKVCLFCTGNGLRVRGDMTRRTLLADLDANMERPELRTFKKNPVQIVLGDRGRYVSACLTIVRAYILADRPGKLPALASFAEWSDNVRSALAWLDCADPVKSMDAAREDDPELAELREFLTIWQTSLPAGEALTVKQMVDATNLRLPTQMGEPTDYAHAEWRECLLRLFGERGAVNTRRLGQFLMTREGRIVAELRIKRAATAKGGLVRWALKKG